MSVIGYKRPSQAPHIPSHQLQRFCDLLWNEMRATPGAKHAWKGHGHISAAPGVSWPDWALAFMTTVLPPANAGPSFQACIAIGKFLLGNSSISDLASTAP